MLQGYCFISDKVLYFCTIYRYKIYRHRNMSQAAQNTKVILLFFRKMATPSLQYRSILIELYLGKIYKLKNKYSKTTRIIRLIRINSVAPCTKKGHKRKKAQAESHYLSFLAAPDIRITQYDATCSAGKLVVLQSRSQS